MMRYSRQGKRTNGRIDNIARYFLLLILVGLEATGCEKELTVAYTDNTEEAIENIVEKKKENEARLEHIANMKTAPYITPCAVSDRRHLMPTGTLDKDYLLLLGENESLFFIDLNDNTLSYVNELDENEWSRSLGFNATTVATDWTPNKARLIDDGIAFSVSDGGIRSLVRYNLQGELLFNINLDEALSLDAEHETAVELIEQDANGNLVLVISLGSLCDELCDWQEMKARVMEVRMASITPQGDVAWQQDYPGKRFTPNQLTVRHDGGYMLTGTSDTWSTNSVIWFLDEQGMLEKEFSFLEVNLPDGSPYNPSQSYPTLRLLAETREADDGTIYVMGSSSGNLTATDGTGEKVTFKNEPGMGDPFFIFQLNSDLGINWSMYDTAADSRKSANVREGFIFLYYHSEARFQLVNNDTIAVIGRVFGLSIVNDDEGDGVKVGMDRDSETTFWLEYNSKGEFLWAQQFGENDFSTSTDHEFFHDPPDTSEHTPFNVAGSIFTNFRVTEDNRLKAFAYDRRLNEVHIPILHNEQASEGFPYPTLAAEVTFCPPE